MKVIYFNGVRFYTFVNHGRARATVIAYPEMKPDPPRDWGYRFIIRTYANPLYR